MVSSKKENLNLTKINFNFNLNKSSFGGKKKKSYNFLGFPRGSKKYLYESPTNKKNMKERKSISHHNRYLEPKKSFNFLLGLGQNFILTRRRKQIDPHLASSKQSIDSSKINFLDMYDNKDKIKIININQIF